MIEAKTRFYFIVDPITTHLNFFLLRIFSKGNNLHISAAMCPYANYSLLFFIVIFPLNLGLRQWYP